jgi:hypothetical protein
MPLFNTQNAKTTKGEPLGYKTYVLYLSSGDKSGREVCKNRSVGCFDTCLDNCGRGQMESVQNARLLKTRYFWNSPLLFRDTLDREVKSAIRNAKADAVPVFRLDGTSDLGLGISLARNNPTAQFYDYTKNYNRMKLYFSGKLPSNYHLTFSWSGNNANACLDVLSLGGNVAAVFDGGMPDTFYGYPVIDGDAHDLRFLDPSPCVVGLKAKGKAKHDTSGFVVRVPPC